MKTLKRLWEAVSGPFISVAVMIDESKRINEDGSWDKCLERKNRRAKNRFEASERKQSRKGENNVISK